MMGRTLVLGDVHGAYRALEQVFERAGVTEEDDIVFLGDVADGWPDVKECTNFLLDLWNEDRLIPLLGNHDKWMKGWFEHPANRPYIWTSQGGRATIRSYGGWEYVPEEHREFLQHFGLYYIQNLEDGRQNLFVHADWQAYTPAHAQKQSVLIWGRELARMAMGPYVGDEDEGRLVPEFDEVFIGHTTTTSRDTDQPIHHRGVWCMDTGAGWSGRLTLMDVETKDYWQSDLTPELYPDVEGR